MQHLSRDEVCIQHFTVDAVIIYMHDDWIQSTIFIKLVISSAGNSSYSVADLIGWQVQCMIIWHLLCFWCLADCCNALFCYCHYVCLSSSSVCNMNLL